LFVVCKITNYYFYFSLHRTSIPADDFPIDRIESQHPVVDFVRKCRRIISAGNESSGVPACSRFLMISLLMQTVAFFFLLFSINGKRVSLIFVRATNYTHSSLIINFANADINLL